MQSDMMALRNRLTPAVSYDSLTVVFSVVMSATAHVIKGLGALEIQHHYLLFSCLLVYLLKNYCRLFLQLFLHKI